MTAIEPPDKKQAISKFYFKNSFTEGKCIKGGRNSDKTVKEKVQLQVNFYGFWHSLMYPDKKKIVIRRKVWLLQGKNAKICAIYFLLITHIFL